MYRSKYKAMNLTNSHDQIQIQVKPKKNKLIIGKPPQMSCTGQRRVGAGLPTLVNLSDRAVSPRTLILSYFILI